MIEIKPPNPIDEFVQCSLFLAGSIEQGAATGWQARLVEYLKDCKYLTIWNPRRDNWDASWKQDIDNPEFKKQVEWEWNALGMSDITAFYIQPDTKSPITLMELGYVLGRAAGRLEEDTLVYCPEGFWRKGNVDVVCKLRGIKVHTDEEKFFRAVRECVKTWGVED